VANRPIESTVQLASVVRDAIPAAARRRGGHPAKRTFQAIRIEVNDELAILPTAIDAAIEVTRPAGRVAVLAYHSGEDRIVKDRFRYAATGGCTCPADLPCVCDAVQTVRLVRPEKRKPSAAEIERNPRSESAILRMVERLPYPITAGQ
jgi:16S rRNA (cytosine1402-N4)-methyltransferase